MTVIAHHLVWTAYGTWLPNDPRGSMSRTVDSPALAELAEAHFGRRPVQPSRRQVKMFYVHAAPKLQYPVVRFDATQIEELGRSLSEIVQLHTYTCYACAIMPDHVHLVIRRHRHNGDEMIAIFQRDSQLRFSFLNALPSEHPLWTQGGWVRYLVSPAAVRTRIRYVEGNPEKEGFPRQLWPFVVEYDDWPYHKAAPSRKLNRKR